MHKFDKKKQQRVFKPRDAIIQHIRRHWHSAYRYGRRFSRGGLKSWQRRLEHLEQIWRVS